MARGSNSTPRYSNCNCVYVHDMSIVKAWSSAISVGGSLSVCVADRLVWTPGRSCLSEPICLDLNLKLWFTTVLAERQSRKPEHDSCRTSASRTLLGTCNSFGYLVSAHEPLKSPSSPPTARRCIGAKPNAGPWKPRASLAGASHARRCELARFGGRSADCRNICRATSAAVGLVSRLESTSVGRGFPGKHNIHRVGCRHRL